MHYAVLFNILRIQIQIQNVSVIWGTASLDLCDACQVYTCGLFFCSELWVFIKLIMNLNLVFIAT